MKTQSKKILTLCFVLLFGAAGMFAQTGLTHGISVENASIVKSGENVLMDIQLDISRMDLKKNGRVLLIPMMVKNSDTLYLKPIDIAGTRQAKYLERNTPKAYVDKKVSVTRKNNTQQVVSYQQSVPYQKWMAGATLAIRQDECECNEIVQTNRNDLERLNVEPPAWNPLLAFVSPEATPKKLEAKGNAYLTFPVGKTVIDPTLGNNAAELEKIYRVSNEVKNTSKATIDRITFHGYASPEGSYALNTRLARERVEALKEYVGKQLSFSGSRISTESTPENWKGLRELVAASNLTHKRQILELIDGNREPDNKEWKIKSTYPEDYKYMLQNFYPQLRRTDYTISYTVGEYTVDEAKALLKTSPQLLNLNEMYLVAQTYPAGSDEFNEVFDIAVRMFPDDELANLNAANIALSRNDLKTADEFLKKAGNCAEAINARGVAAMLSGDLEQALSLLKEAQQKGISQAEENSKQIEYRIENY